MCGYHLFFRKGVHRDAPAGAIARVVIVVYGELIAGAWDVARLVNGGRAPAVSGRHSSVYLHVSIPMSVFRFVIIKICIIPLMTSGEAQQRVRSG